MADDFEPDAALACEELTEEHRDAARKTVARNATDTADCTQLLAMLGLLPGERQRGCRQCGGPLTIAALSSANGYRGCCSPTCRDILFAVMP